MHIGHQAMIGGVVDATRNHIIFVGSCNEPISYRNLFKFADRVGFIKAIHTKARVAGLPDFRGDNDSWFKSLDCAISLTGADPKDVVFVGGCQADVAWFEESNRDAVIVNRYSGVTANISGSEIRDHLITKNYSELINVIDSRIIDDVIAKFENRWKEFKKQ